MKTSILNTLLACEEGAAAIEYGLIAGLIALALVGTMTTVGERLRATFQVIANSLVTR